MNPALVAVLITAAATVVVALVNLVAKKVKPVVTMGDLLTEVQEERNGLKAERDSLRTTIDAVRTACDAAIAEVKAEAARAIAEVKTERDATIGDLRTQMRVLLAENAELRDYAHDLRRDITDGKPPPPRDWPKGLPA